jgi:hypothetical protein
MKDRLDISEYDRVLVKIPEFKAKVAECTPITFESEIETRRTVAGWSRRWVSFLLFLILLLFAI